MMRIFCGLLLTSSLLAEPSTLQTLPSVAVTPYVPSEGQAETLLREPFAESFALYALPGGEKLGWRSLSLEVGEPGALRLRESTQYRYALGSATFDQRSEETWTFDASPPYTLRAATREAVLQGKRMVTRLTRTGRGEYRAEITEAGESRARDFSNLQLTILDRLGFRLWACGTERRRGDCQAFRGFDLKSLESYSERYCVQHPVRDGGLIEVAVENLKDHFTLRLALQPGGQVLSAVEADSMEWRGVDAREAKRFPVVADVWARSLLKCPQPLAARIKAGENLRFTLRGPGLKELPRTIFQKVKLDATAQSAALLTGHDAGTAIPATPGEIKSALATSLVLPWTDARVQRLARQACEGAESPREKVWRLLRFVSEYVTDDDHAKPLGLISVLKNPRGDCTAHALLFTALARAAGIPCREASGYLYLSDAMQAFGGHAWNEVVLDGNWHPVDPTWNQFTLDAGHIQLSTGSPTARDAQYFRGEMTLRVD